MHSELFLLCRCRDLGVNLKPLLARGAAKLPSWLHAQFRRCRLLLRMLYLASPAVSPLICCLQALWSCTNSQVKELLTCCTGLMLSVDQEAILDDLEVKPAETVHVGKQMFQTMLL